MVQPNDVLEFRRSGVQPYVVQKLRKGEYPEADFIDLHGKTIEQAYEQVMQFLAFAKSMNSDAFLSFTVKAKDQILRP